MILTYRKHKIQIVAGGFKIESCPFPFKEIYDAQSVIDGDIKANKKHISGRRLNLDARESMELEQRQNYKLFNHV